MSQGNPYTNPNVQFAPSGSEYHNQSNGAGAAGTRGTYGATGAGINDPTVNGNAYQYGGKQGGAAAQNAQYQGLAAAQAAQQGAQIQNQYDPRDQSQVQGTLGQLGSFYQGQMNGTGPSLASAQMQQATDQSIAAQMAAANSARGGLAGAAAQRQASQQGAAMQQNAAQQSMQGRIQEEYNAAQGMQGVGQLSEGEQNINAQTAYQQAALQQQQQDINARSALGYGQLENQVNTEQLNAQQQQQAQQSSNYLAASGMGMNQSQFNTNQTTNEVLGGIEAGGMLLAAAADADLQEPGGPAHWTLREEDNYILAKNQRTGEMRALATRPLTDREFNQAMSKHGAGPLGGEDPRRMRTTFHDFQMGAPNMGMAPQPVIGRPGTPAIGPVMQQPRPAPGGGMQMRAPMPGAGMPPQQMAPPPGLGAARPMSRVMPDMDLGAGRHYHAHDADMTAARSTMVMPPGSLPPAGGPPPNPYDPAHTMALPASAYPQSAPTAPANLGGLVGRHPVSPLGGGLAISMPAAPTADQVENARALTYSRPGDGYVPFSRPTGQPPASAPAPAQNRGQLSGLAGAKATPAAAAPPSFGSRLGSAMQGITQTAIPQMMQRNAAPAAQSGLADAYASNFTPMAVPSYAPPMADMDLGTTQRVGRPMTPARTTLGPRGMAYGPANTDGLRGHMDRLQAADMDLRSRGRKRRTG